jgi:nitrous oxidase accessory protein
MRNSLFRKDLVLGITLLFITTTFLPCIDGSQSQLEKNVFKSPNQITYENTNFNDDFKTPIPLNLSDGLVGYWNFDEGIGDIAHDSSGYTNDGTLYGNPTWTAGRSGNALSFDGIDDWIDCGNDSSLSPSTAITLTAWYKPTISWFGGGPDPIINKPINSDDWDTFYQYHLGVCGDLYPDPYANHFGISLYIDVDGNYQLIQSPENMVSFNQWSFIVGIYDGSTMKLYIDDILISSIPVSGEMTDYHQNLRIAKYKGDNQELFLPGVIDEIRIYDRALTEEETHELFIPSIVYVDDDYNSSTPGWGYNHFSSVQDAIDAVDFNGNIFVSSGIYYENLLIEKNYLKIYGENKNNTIIDANSLGNVITFQNQENYEYNGKYNFISGFTLRNAGGDGVYIHDVGRHGPPHPEYNKISDCLIYNCSGSGIYLYSDHEGMPYQSFLNCNIYNNSGYGVKFEGRTQTDHTISDCQIYNNQQGGINLVGTIYNWGYSGRHIIRNNSICNNNGIGLSITADNFGNIIYHNNFLENDQNAYDNCNNIWYPATENNTWYNATLLEGNYWSDYTGIDVDGDGIGDTPYNISDSSNQDLYPLMQPWGENDGIYKAGIYGTGGNSDNYNPVLIQNVDGYLIRILNYNETQTLYAVTHPSTPGDWEIIKDITCGSIDYNNPDGIYINGCQDEEYMALYPSGITEDDYTVIINIRLDRPIQYTVSIGAIIFNYEDENNYYRAELTTCPYPYFKLWKWENGVRLDVSDYYHMPLMAGVTYDLKIKVSNSQQELYVYIDNGVWNYSINISEQPPEIVYVDNDFTSSTPGWGYDHFNLIQNGINAVATNGTVFVYNGTFYEHLIINKTINLLGENRESTIIDGSYYGNVVFVTADRVNISGFLIQNGYYGIKLFSANNCKITLNNESYNNEGAGFYLEDSNNCTIIGNDGFHNDMSCCFFLDNCNNTLIMNNNANAFMGSGICLGYSNNCTITGNNAVFNYEGSGISLSYSNDCIIMDNNVGGHSGISSYGSNRLLISGNNVNLSGYNGIILTDCDNCTITCNNANSGEGKGINIQDSNDNIIMGNNASNCFFGIEMSYSNNNTIIENRVISGTVGINVEQSNYNTIMANEISNNGLGIIFYLCDDNIVTSNNVILNSDGIHFYNSNSNIIIDNNVSSNDYGVYLESSITNIISNNFFNNTYNAYDDSNNIWNITKTPGTNIIDGPYLGGNYWSDYTGLDNNGDGLGDTDIPYGPGDYLPLVAYVNLPPVVNFTHTLNDKTLSFNASTSFDINGFITDYLWQFGDGINGTGVIANHTYMDYGNYLVSLTVIDNEGDSNTTTKYVSVEDLIQPEIWAVQDYPDPQHVYEHINISCFVMDNVGISTIKVHITDPESSTINQTMYYNTITHLAYLNSTYSKVGGYDYFIWMNDTNENSNITSVYHFVIYDAPGIPPSDPIPTDGAIGVNTSVELLWQSYDPDPEDLLTFDVYFGTSNPPPKVANNITFQTYNPGTLTFDTTYYWRIIAWNPYGGSMVGPIWHFTTRQQNPPNAPLINGPTSGNAEEEYTYTFVAVDPNDDNVYYEINWGDGQVDDWYGPCASNLVITRTHTWSEKGTYVIQARAKDIYGAIGEWGSLSVTMPTDFVLGYQSSQQIISFQMKKIMS